MKKSQTKQTDVVNTKDEAKKQGSVLTRVTGIFFFGISVSMYAQAVPLMFIFIGVFLGIPTDTKIGNMDSMIWVLTCVTLMLLSLYGMIQWLKYVWKRFIIEATPLFKFKRKVKHAE